MTSELPRICVRRALGDLAPEVQHNDAVGYFHHQRHVVFDQQQRFDAVADQLPEHAAQLMRFLRVQARRRLIQHQQLRTGAERNGEFQQPKFAAGKRIGFGVHSIAEADLFDDRRRLVAKLPLALALRLARKKGTQQRRLAVPVTRRQHVAEHGQPLQHIGLLKRPDQARLRDRVGRAAGDVGAPVSHRSRGRPVEAGDQVETGGLARAVRPDQADDLAGAHLEGDIRQRRQAAKPLRDAAEFKHRRSLHADRFRGAG